MSHEEQVLLQLAGVLVLGIGAQWLAWKLQLPSILLLLALGFVAGPATGLIDPDALFGELLFPMVSLAVGLILFEGGLSLRLAHLREIGWPLWSLITVGAAMTWVLAAGAAYLVLGLDGGAALLLGAILVVTGPTVIGPLLRHVRPTGRVASVAHWEGIVIDPVGAVLAVLVYEALAVAPTTGALAAARAVLPQLGTTLLAGLAIGGFAAYAALELLRRFWVPDYLQSPLLLMLVTGAFTVSNLVQPESGLLTVTLMGVILANQSAVPVKHIIEFKENLRVLLIASLFILLAARVAPADFTALGWRGPLFVAFLIVVVRPAAVLVSTLLTSLSFKERLFLAWLAPRGIVAASVASVFALRMGDAGTGLVPATFLVIVGTVAVYGLTAAALARRLGLSNPNPQGILFASAHAGSRAIAKAVKAAGFPVLLVDNNRFNATTARLEGLPTAWTSVLSEDVFDGVPHSGLGRLLALTPDDEVNALAALHFREVFGRAEVYQLPPRKGGSPRLESAAPHLRGRYLFARDATYDTLDRRFADGYVVKSTKLSPEFDWAAFRQRHGEDALPLFVVTETGTLVVCVADRPAAPRPGQTVISLVKPVERAATEAGEAAAAGAAAASGEAR
jgi:NhaP-type Na+/H+ or K+/H+ antiporter